MEFLIEIKSEDEYFMTSIKEVLSFISVLKTGFILESMTIIINFIFYTPFRCTILCLHC